MKDLLNKNIFWIFLIVSSVTIFTLLFSNKVANVIVETHYDKIADAVVRKLEKDYCPSPYGPGIDPDKIDLDAILRSKNDTNWENAWGEQRGE